jgi:hypothetical protein
MHFHLTKNDACHVFETWLQTKKDITSEYYSISAEIKQGRGFCILVNIDIFMEDTLVIEFDLMVTYQGTEFESYIINALQFRNQIQRLLWTYHKERLKCFGTGAMNTVKVTRMTSKVEKCLATLSY